MRFRSSLVGPRRREGYTSFSPGREQVPCEIPPGRKTGFSNLPPRGIERLSSTSSQGTCRSCEMRRFQLYTSISVFFTSGTYPSGQGGQSQLNPHPLLERGIGQSFHSSSQLTERQTDETMNCADATHTYVLSELPSGIHVPPGGMMRIAGFTAGWWGL